MDDSYETPAENHGDTRPKVFGNTYKTVGHVGAGIAFKLSNRLNIALKIVSLSLMMILYDGQRWAEQVPGSPVKLKILILIIS
jgi:hypothetical protein